MMKLKKYLKELNQSIKDNYGEDNIDVYAGYTVLINKDYDLEVFAQTDKDDILNEISCLSSGVLIEASRIELAYDLLFIKEKLTQKEFNDFIEDLKSQEGTETWLVDEALEYVENYERSCEEEAELSTEEVA